MLQLDIKKVRKGKPVAFPYVGSKRKISKKIIQIIKENFGTEKKIYDIFGGGAAVTFEGVLQGLDIQYNEKNKDVSDMVEYIINATETEKDNLFISREEFHGLKNKENKTTIDNLKSILNSFGYTGKGYLFHKKDSEEKHNNYKDKNYNGVCIQRRRRNLLNDYPEINITNKDYTEFSKVKNAILYLDPPYENTHGYVDVKAREVSAEKYQEMRNKLLELPRGTILKDNYFEFKLGQDANNYNRMYVQDKFNGFEYLDFYEWAYKMSKDNIVLISSYEVSDDRFIPVYEFETARSTLSGGFSDKTQNKIERLFMVKEQAREYI